MLSQALKASSASSSSNLLASSGSISAASLLDCHSPAGALTLHVSVDEDALDSPKHIREQDEQQLDEEEPFWVHTSTGSAEQPSPFAQDSSGLDALCRSFVASGLSHRCAASKGSSVAQKAVEVVQTVFKLGVARVLLPGGAFNHLCLAWGAESSLAWPAGLLLALACIVRVYYNARCCCSWSDSCLLSCMPARRPQLTHANSTNGVDIAATHHASNGSSPFGGMVARSCPKPILMPRRSRQGSLANHDELTVFVPPHELAASSLLDPTNVSSRQALMPLHVLQGYCQQSVFGCIAAPAAHTHCCHPSLPQVSDSLCRKGSAAIRLRSGVLRRTGFLEGHTEAIKPQTSATSFRQ
jgi:hypothetical protein